jgi:regulator of sirC expression with transglutaminase-like and TPR domain
VTSTHEAFRAIVRDDPADLATPCLLIARALSEFTTASEADVVAAGNARLDALAAQVHRPDLEGLHGALRGYAGRPEDHRRLESSLLPEVLRSQRGLPILLSVVWLEVARRAAVPACGLAIPGRFVIAVGADHEQSIAPDAVAGLCTLVDPFAGGVPLTIAQVQDIARQGGADAESLDPVRLLAPAAPVDVLHRILRNIRMWAGRPERAQVALAACEFALLLPRRPIALTREHAELLGRTGRFKEAATSYAAYADAIESVDPEAAERARVNGRLARGRLN